MASQYPCGGGNNTASAQYGFPYETCNGVGAFTSDQCLKLVNAILYEFSL